MSGLEENALSLTEEAEAKRYARLSALEATREEYEAKRDYYQLLMDTTDKMILETQKQTVSPL